MRSWHCKGTVTSAEIGIWDIRLNNYILQTAKGSNCIVQLCKIRNFGYINTGSSGRRGGDFTHG